MLNKETRERLFAASGPPTDLAKFGESLGVVEVERKELKVDGMVLPKGSGYKVILNSNRAAKSSFSLAHELAHIIIQSGALAKAQFRGATRSHKQLENLCDKIAAEILMPEEQFRDHMDRLGLELSNVPNLKRIFDTSFESTAIRFADFLPFPAVLSKWSMVSGQLTHNWSRSNGRCRPYRYGMPRGNKAKDMGEFGPQRALKSSSVVQSEEPLMRSQSSSRGERYRWMKFPTESLAIGPQEYRYVLALSRIDNAGHDTAN